MNRNKGKGKQGTKKAFLVFAAAMFLFMTGIGGAFADYLSSSRVAGALPIPIPFMAASTWALTRSVSMAAPSIPHDLR